MRTKARRSCGSLLRIEEMSRLSTSLKLPSKSPSILPVSVRFFDISGHSRLSPKRVERGVQGWAGIKGRVRPGIQPYAGKWKVVAIGVAAVMDERRLDKAIRRERDRPSLNPS